MTWPFKSSARRLSDLQSRRAGLSARRDATRRMINAATSVRGGIVLDLLDTEQELASLDHRIAELKAKEAE
ncbi:hypothetical protein PQR39_35365 [Paraburkholderia sediminicola]|uniref:hypothetical protein n=1 Tax=Paraburkholderia sediminicola TaxID=458836 RepID=UPI0038BB22E7